MPPPQRPISRILVANRGEIAIRILQSCHELAPQPPTTFAIYTDNDSTHISLGRPHHAIKAAFGPASYMNIDYLIGVVKEHKIDAVHPGYGFLSESAEFSRRMWEEAGCVVVGPGWEVLERTGDKLMAKALASECGVPVLKAMERPTGSVEDVRRFAASVGYPLMIKAVDGGGGRGIRLVKSEDALDNAVQRCVAESPSRLVFAEQAAVEGYKHIEVQIVGDGKGGVTHLWERDCSVQRRFQKIVELAPAPVQNRKVIAQVIDSAVRMATQLKYLGLGTWEYLVNVQQEKFFFLEINPRLQVEHTITECITGVDLVKQQLLLAQGLQTRLGGSHDANKAPPSASIQLRLCAEDPTAGFSLSIGKVSDVQFPSGNGVRVDSHLSRGGVVGSDFDNMMAKVIVTASTWEECVGKARRALEETKIVGVKSNLNLLKAILTHERFAAGDADTSWLERNLDQLVALGEQLGSITEIRESSLPALSLSSSNTPGSAVGGAGASTLFRKGDAWTLVLENSGEKSSSSVKPPAHHLSISRVTRNEFPAALIADISYTIPGARTHSYKMTLNSTTSSADAAASTHRRGDPSKKTHIVLPMSGKLVEVLVDEGDEVRENEVIAFVKQMKMELEVRSPRAGKVKWVIEMENEEEGDDVAEGVLLVELEDEEDSAKKPEVRSRL
ncbi:uncharacterized protein Z520_04003 [Fonsecaea multimorphosa CBS 102226]|uniref:Pyruvate carboxylase n=1 Tax=Fonsecaea multimorphosa CBS 102226 TaxID=1442371 RepID=A0A0D2K3B9_9EURO|nr:uncharacterized protein Z520_04003 [Fonsecaea multimorphosa CBS 102226]KIY00318.1 hypothetical protein Z520_04003 [Fonsecaea multimorphosa CBS 102226]OAL27150.1 hypothetical protein AYO22_03781 [Fonsecaea multimorphosa]